MSSSPTSTIVSSSRGTVLDDEPWSLNDAPACCQGWHPLPASLKSQRTMNPIRAIVDPIVASMQQQSSLSGSSNHHQKKDPISLALGDPTTAGHLLPCPVALQAIRDVVTPPTYHDADHNLEQQQCLAPPPHAAAGYVSALGTPQARRAIAQHCHIADDSCCSADAVIVANGCSGALELALTALLDENSVLLVPQPGFPLYRVICESHGARVASYRLNPAKNWEVDVAHLHELMQEYNTSTTTSSSDHHGTNGTMTTTGGKQQPVPQSRGRRGGPVRALLINNPSNPTGAVFSKSHLQDLLRFCQEYHIPLVSDEVYGDLTFSSAEQPDDDDTTTTNNNTNVFYPAAQVAAEMGRHVPVITASGLAKQFLVPGWRVGWIVFQDNIYGSLYPVQEGAKRLAQVILGASHLSQMAIPALLDPSNPAIQEWKGQFRQTLQEQAHFVCSQLAAVPGLHVYWPGGAMYAMVRIDTDQFRASSNIANDMDFTKLLLLEENVLVLPGSCFGFPNAFRVVFCAPIPVLREAANRISQFCERHRV